MTNTEKSVDLDLSVIGESGKIGWDGGYRSDDRGILFSGDVVDAPKPKGASEVFYIKSGLDEAKILTVNYFNFSDGDEVECKILAAHESPTQFDGDYMVDVNNMVATANINITKKQNVLGLIKNVDGENRVYFANVSIGNSITARDNLQATQAREYLVSSLVNSLSLTQALLFAGANVVDEKPEGDCIDLSPECLTKSTIIDLIKPS